MEHYFGQFNLWFIVAIALLSIWSLAWKGYAMWKSARLGHKWWFIIILLINTVGILEIIYIFIIVRQTKIDLQTVEVRNNI